MAAVCMVCYHTLHAFLHVDHRQVESTYLITGFTVDGFWCSQAACG
jgi:hypothetical protein